VLPGALACRVELRDQFFGTTGAAVRPGGAPLRPGVALPVAQPENAGPCVGRIVHAVLERPLLAVMQYRAFDRAAVADRTLVETACHPRIRHDPARAHRGGEGGMARDPVVDGARRDFEVSRQRSVGGAQQAVIAGKLAKFGAVGGGTSGGRHN